MTAVQVPLGTPDDWWEQAEPITHAEAEERTLGDWYITKVATAGDTKPNYRLSTPSRPPSQHKKDRPRHNNGLSDRVRCLIRTHQPLPAWQTAHYVLADLERGSERRVPWARKKTGRWHCLEDGRRTINDNVMAELHPEPATFTTESVL